MREKLTIEHSKSLEFDKLSAYDKSEKDDEDKKSVRFNLDNNTDIGITFSDKSSSEEELMTSDKKIDDIINVKLTPSKSRFTVSPVVEPASGSLKLIKPNPKDFIKPKLTLSKGSDSEDDTKSIEKVPVNNVSDFFDSDNSSSEHGKIKIRSLRKPEQKAEKKVEALKQKIWEEKNEELAKFQTDLQKSHKEELKRLLEEEKQNQDEVLKTEIKKLKSDVEISHQNTLKDVEMKLKEKLEKVRLDLEENVKEDEKRLKDQFDMRREELEKYYEDKLVETEKDLAEKVDKTKEEITFTHNANIEQLKQNHSILIEELKREFKIEEQVLKKDHQSQMAQLKAKMQNELEMEKNKSYCDERTYEKLRCEKRLLEDKYKCLKEKYFRLKTDVKLSIEKKNRRKEQSTTTNTTGSETEQSNSNNKDR